ncbi:30S ribosomal protein S7 [Borrelia miyamotoi]|uniref:Small ribosomal subunit protein uS7 n=1 Tax=Borrelia miyamotoi TaxID=47466 RepID=A0AAP8YRT9_9SPIR|nr:30S ribosomal protein S7 [Borrelia miyamotoi]AHH05031.1 SSU ribosomal protein S7P [Borrelia miyamotoi FR64b]ASQ29175.1 30S ribosomal protein S7 [Borrelia miyamotoi]ATQ14830.1 30S ribosomal protein S7 [Borrelia miyamotoi]ATQ16012.1 30S ribosomal protein S7 [Borrelia miyamotoi]ATQ17158.1 30S ribosomal protein S7 [Borrelia miyamotoi]
MSRKSKKIKKKIFKDTKYDSRIIAKFVNRMMYDGKKSISEAIMYSSIDMLSEKIEEGDKITAFNKALENVKPLVEVRSRRVGGATYQVPVEIREERREALAMKWIIAAARKSSGKSMQEKLANELVNAYNATGVAFKKKEDTHRMAEANRAFTHYRW